MRARSCGQAPAKNADGRLRKLYAHAAHSGFTRLRIGLEDLDTAALTKRLAPGKGALMVAKHLCGAGTDYALRSAVSARAAGAPPVAVVLATCCHHRCTWGSYPNRAFLRRLGLGRANFEALCRVASWAVDGKREAEGGAAASTRNEVGRCAKDLLDQGRVEYMRAHGFSANLETYVDGAVSPENVLIVVTAGGRTDHPGGRVQTDGSPAPAPDLRPSSPPGVQ